MDCARPRIAVFRGAALSTTGRSSSIAANICRSSRSPSWQLWRSSSFRQVVGRRAARCSQPWSTAFRSLSIMARATSPGGISPSTVNIEETLGEGSFGTVLLATIKDDGGRNVKVVMKRSKDLDIARECIEAEVYMNERVEAECPGSCAKFLGSMRVTQATATPKLPEGLYLFWRYDGRRTLSGFLRSPIYPMNLAEALYGQEMAFSYAEPELPVAQLVLSHILGSLNALHSVGLVHRDVKPLNLILSERDRAFKLIDLGACADLRTGRNFTPDETILDPKYSPPEEFLMPIDAAPDLAKASGPVAFALGAASWARYQPDRFDTYSAGIVFMQMALPTLRSDKGLKWFNKTLAEAGYDLSAWKARMRPSFTQTAVLDAGGGAGWELAEGLLRPKVLSGALPAATGGKTRLTAAEALACRFFRVEAVTVVKGTWNPMRGIAVTLGGLERAISKQAQEVSETSLQLRSLINEGTDVRTIKEKTSQLQQQEQGLQGLFGLFRTSASQLQGFLAKDIKKAARDGQRGLTALSQAAAAVRSEGARALAELAEELTQEGAAEDTIVPQKRAVASGSGDGKGAVPSAAGNATVAGAPPPQQSQPQPPPQPQVSNEGVGARIRLPGPADALVGSGESQLTANSLNAALESAATAAAEAASVAAAEVAAVAKAEAQAAEELTGGPVAGAPAVAPPSQVQPLAPLPPFGSIDEEEQRRVRERMAALQDQMEKAAERLAAMESAMARQREMMRELEALMGAGEGAAPPSNGNGSGSKNGAGRGR